MNQDKIEAVAERILDQVNDSLTALNLLVGKRLGLFEILSKTGPVTPAELAARSGYSERYLREWLECLTVNDYIEHQNGTGRFVLSLEVAHVLVDQDSKAFVAPVLDAVPAVALVHDQVVDAFRTGGGVSFETCGPGLVDSIGSLNPPQFLNDLPSAWFDALPDIRQRLERGGRVVDVGCGTGWSSIAIARAFPRAIVEAVEPDDTSVERGIRNVKEAGIDGRIRFHRCVIEQAPLQGPYDLVVAFECLHDMAYPVRALEVMRSLIGGHGAVLIGDERVEDSIEGNRSFLGRWNYNWSVLHCLPQAMVYPQAAGTGTVIKPSTLREYAKQAGFGGVEVLPIDHEFWRFYRLYA